MRQRETERVELKPIAIYLPQFHPIPENDRWWGKGFTEWTNVTKARPLFKGHYQPHLPADLGFYDLRLPEVREAQAELARRYGIYGFCYYHYWFTGKRLLERPFQEVLESGRPDFPFCLCWANENWTRRWDGKDREILMEQKYSDEDDRNHIRSLAQAFMDKRYIRYQGKPIFLVYKNSEMTDPKRTAEIWREEALKLGIGELFLCQIERSHLERRDPKTVGFDASVEFHPNYVKYGLPLRQGRRWDLLRSLGLSESAFVEHEIFSYEQVVNNILRRRASHDYLFFPTVVPSWDNTARRKTGAFIFHGSTPELFEHWISHIIDEVSQNSELEGLFFINAWNEWAEGNHLEPCQKWGLGYLEAVEKALKMSRTCQV